MPPMNSGGEKRGMSESPTAFTVPITLLLGTQLLSCMDVAPVATFFPV